MTALATPPTTFTGLPLRREVSPLTPADPPAFGRYLLVGRLGEGGMGTVYLGRDAGNRLVAIKVVRNALSGDEASQRRFRSEVARARQVPPFCTAEVLDADLEHVPPYLVVEYVDGPSLDDVVTRNGPLSPANLQALAIGGTVALTAIHDAGVIHRDLKPSNVLLAPGSPKVIDFGLALPTGITDTGERRVTGTIPYMAPERFGPDAARSITPASDIFAWGAVVAFAGTGRLPFPGGDATEIALRIMNDPPDLAGLTEPLRGIVEWALAKNPRDRPTARQLLDRLTSGQAGAQCPYQGLAAYQEADARRFFGREELIASLVARLADRLDRSGVLAVLGASGSGKSSLLRAGLLAELDRGRTLVPGAENWPRLLLTPGPHPLRELAAAVASLAGVPGGALHDELLGAPDQFPVHVLQALRAPRPGRAPVREPGGDTKPERATRPRLILVVDQFEEVFTLCEDDDERRAFIAALVAAAGTGAEDQTALVVLGVRADYYARCSGYPALVPMLEENVTVGPMSAAQLRRAIEEPARQAGLTLEPGLVEVLLRDIGSRTGEGSSTSESGYPAGTLPLLSHALYATWEQRQEQLLSLAGYRATGGVEGAVAASAEAVYQELSGEDRVRLRRLLLRMIRVGDDTEDVRRRTDVADLITRDPGADTDAARLLNRLAAARLVTVGQETAEITHEALIRAWPRLRTWLAEDRADLLARQRLGEAARTWREENRDTGGLYAGTRLATAQDLIARWQGPELVPLEREFLDASARASSRRVHRMRLLIALGTVLVLMIGAMAEVAFDQYRTSRQQQSEAASRQIAALADALRATDPAAALQLSLAAYREDHTPAAESSIYASYSNPFPTSVRAQQGSVLSLVYTPDGRTLVSAAHEPGKTDSIVVWNVGDGRHPVERTRLPGLFGTLAISPDGHWLVVNTYTALTVWDIRDPDHPTRQASVPIQRALPFSVTFRPDGRSLATSRDNQAQLWDFADPRHPVMTSTVTPDAKYLTSVAFSPDGHTLATASNIGDNDLAHVRTWKVADPAHPALDMVLTARSAEAVAFSPTRHLLVSVGVFGECNAWDVTDPRHPVDQGPLSNIGDGSFISVAFSPDGDRFAAASTTGEVKTWTINKYGITTGTRLPGTGALRSIAFRPDGRGLATGADSGSVHLWSPATVPLDGQLPGTFNLLPGKPFDPTGHLLATAAQPASGSDRLPRTARIWDVTDRTRPVLLSQLPAEWPYAGFLPGNGHTLISRDEQNDNLRLWDATDPRHPTAAGTVPITGPADGRPVEAASVDGSLLAVGDYKDTKVHLWSVSDPAHPVAVTEIASAKGVQGLAFMDRNLLTVWGTKDIELWDVTDPARPVRASVFADAAQGSLAYLPERHLLITQQDNSVGVSEARLWDLSDTRRPLKGAVIDTQNGTFDISSPDGRTLAVAAHGVLELWDISDIQHPVIHSATSTSAPINLLMSSPDSRILLGSDDTLTPALHVWRVGSGPDADPAEAATLPGAFDLIDQGSMAFSPDSRTLAANSHYGGGVFGPQDGVALWDLDAASVYRSLCAVHQTPIDPTTWHRYFPALGYRPPCP